MNRYDDRARLVFHFAREEGSKLGHAMIGPEHLLLGLMREGGNTSHILDDFGATLEGLRRQVEELAGRGSNLERNETAAITPRARRVMELAGSEAQSLGHNRIFAEHILLGIIRDGEGVAYRLLQGLAQDPDAIRWRILEVEFPESTVEDPSPRLRFDPYGWSETYVGLDKLSAKMEVRLGLRLLARGVRRFFLRR